MTKSDVETLIRLTSKLKTNLESLEKENKFIGHPTSSSENRVYLNREIDRDIFKLKLIFKNIGDK